MNRAFTLIELLVVIAIIGVISTLGVVSFSSAREKARISNGLNFESQMLHLSGDELIGRWGFDECGGTSSADMSGNNLTATLTASTLWSTDTPSGKGCSLSLNGVDQYAYADSAINRLISEGGPLTLSIWAKGNVSPWDGSYAYVGLISSRNSLGAYVFDTVAGTKHIALWLSDGTSWPSYSSGDVADTRDWHQYTVVYGDNTVTHYVDGKKTGSTTFASTMRVPTGARIYFGCDSLVSDRYFNGLIDSPRVYRKGLTAQEVQYLFAEESASRFVARE